MSPTESDLRSYLRHEAEDVDARGNLAAAVFAAKRRSDRRRAGGLVGLTALAVAAPLAWSSFVGGPSPDQAGQGTILSTSTPSTPSASTPASPTPAPTVTSHMADALVTARPTLSDEAEFVDPGVPYSARGTFHEDGQRLTGPLDGGYPTFERLDHGGYLLHATSGSDQRVHIVFPDGRSTVVRGAQNAVVSADRSRIAWLDGSAVVHPGEGVIHIADSTGVELTTVTVDATPTALVGDVLYGIRLFGYDYAGESVRIDLSSGARTEFKGNVMAVHAESGLALVNDQITEGEPEKPRDLCYRIVDSRTPSLPTRLRACGDTIPYAFSPDGRYLLARGGNDGILVVDASDGRIVLDALGSTGLRGQSARLSDDGSAIVLSVLSADLTRNGLVRCTLSGECQQVGGPSVAEPPPDDSNTPRTGFGLLAN